MSKYIILNENKGATHRFRDGEGTYSYEQVKYCDNLGLYIEPPYIVLDIDIMEEAEWMLRIVDKFNLKTRVMKTTRGYHFWFK